jgi:cyclase
MARKRLIFTLLYDRGSFMFSRNFRLQKIGDINWLKKNYGFSNFGFSIDELIVLDVSRNERNRDEFSEVLKTLTNDCFAPIAAGGGINSVVDATKLLRSGADKIVVNSALHSNKQLISELAQEFGRQCIIASVDCKQIEGKFFIATNNGSNMTELTLIKFLEQCSDLAIGEICINSIDRDGTGNGFQIELLDCLPELFEIPVIISGGVGNYSHLAEGLKDARVDAVATANLLNFMGDGLASARSQLVNLGIDLTIFDRN